MQTARLPASGARGSSPQVREIGSRLELFKDPILTAPGDDHWPHFDSHNTALWDSNLGQYVAYMRGMDPRRER